MGRPPLDNQPTVVRLSREQRERMEELVGSRGMSAFVREAVANELTRREAELSRDENEEQDDSPKPGR